MAQRDYRARMSPTDFAGIACDDDYPLDDYFAKLVDGNVNFRGIYQEFPRGYEDINLIQQLTPGQQLLILLGVLDGQICNGGITQFFWNNPECLFDVRDAIERLGDPAVLNNYERALEALVGKKERWLELRQECYGHKYGPSWESFRQTYDLLDLSWFDQAYFDKRGYNEKNEWVRVERGLQHRFLHRLTAYIRSHRSDFIEE